MKLLFDLTACQNTPETKNHGGKEYSIDILKALQREGKSFDAVYDSTLEIESWMLDYCKSNGTLIDVYQTSLQTIINKGNYDVFYSGIPYNYGFIDFGKTKFIGTVHGIRDMEVITDKYELKYAIGLRQYISYFLKNMPIVGKFYQKRLINKYRALLSNPAFVGITDTEHSKYSFACYFHEIDFSEYKVFFCPLTLLPVNKKANRDKYYLIVSGNRWIKNTYRAAMALDELMTNNNLKGRVVITGCSSKHNTYKEIKNKDRFDFLGYVEDTELRELYANAHALIFLSLSEGWGYPPFEAISCSTPVVCSPFTSLYEVYGNAVLYANPYSIEEIKNRILQLDNEKIRNQILLRAEQRYSEIVVRQQSDLQSLVDFICE